MCAVTLTGWPAATVGMVAGSNSTFQLVGSYPLILTLVTGAVPLLVIEKT